MCCANSGCEVEALYSRSGSLHWIDSLVLLDGPPPRRTIRLIWLCSACGLNVLVETWRPANEQIHRQSGEVILIDRDLRRPPAESSHPVLQSA